jgi:putative cardiolipin synthase
MSLGIVLFLASCASPPVNQPKEFSSALRTAPNSGVAGDIRKLVARHPGKSGFALIDNNRAAFTDRIALADYAQKTLDVQYYIWSADTIGKILADHVIQAADRGVRVRCLVDDMYLKSRDEGAAVLAAHPNIEVRVFNPHRFRSLRTLNFALDFTRLNHRMHNKTMIMDNACAIIGGRNMADEYFGLNDDFNMRDLDIVAVGPIVPKVSNVFDEFWNSEAAVPAENLLKNQEVIDNFRQQVAILRKSLTADRYPFPLTMDVGQIKSRWNEVERAFVWADGEVFHNSYESLKHPGHGESINRSLTRELLAAKHEVRFEAAYYVTRRRGIELGRKMVDNGVKIRVLTNSLATNDVGAAQAGYARTRKTLLRGGVELYELRPDAAALRAQVAPHAKQARTAIHTKALVIDGRKSFVGSYNLDPRSANINSEVGLMVNSEEFARRVAAYLDQGVRPENSYRVSLDEHGHPRWQTIINGQPRTLSHDPETTTFQRLTNRLIGYLPITSQL